MQKVLLPSEQAELAKTTAKVVEAERLLSDVRHIDVRWAWLPATEALLQELRTRLANRSG